MPHVAVMFIQFSSVFSSIPTLLTKWCSDFHQLTTMQPGGSKARLNRKQKHVLKKCIVYAL